VVEAREGENSQNTRSARVGLDQSVAMSEDTMTRGPSARDDPEETSRSGQRAEPRGKCSGMGTTADFDLKRRNVIDLPSTLRSIAQVIIRRCPNSCARDRAHHLTFDLRNGEGEA
jgi:hypothetical protein